jgi:hypothetical protein
MAQFVFEFASKELGSVADAVETVVAPFSEISVAQTEEGDSWEYVETTLDFEHAVAEMSSGSLMSVLVRGNKADIRYGLITCPRFNGGKLSSWMGTVEFIGNEWQPIWNSLLSNPALQVVCVGLDEGVELEDELLSPESFPWDVWPTFAGAVRDARGEWFKKEPC